MNPFPQHMAANSTAPDNVLASDFLASKCPPRLMVERETAKAYAAFVNYFDQGDSRSIGKVLGNCGFSEVSLYKWRTQFRWDERIDTANAEVAAIFRVETEKRAAQVADILARQRLEIAAGNFRLAKAAQAKAEEVLRFVVVKDIQTSQDGKTIIIKCNPNIRLGDAVRLGLGANILMVQAEAALAPKGRGKTSHSPDSSPGPIAGRDGPMVEVFLDGGDGVPLPASQMPPQDRLDPDFHPEDDTAEAA